MERTDRRKSRAAALSVMSNTTLVGAKLAAGLAAGSVAIISEAAHSAVDLLAALIAFVAVRKSGEPADWEHPFGHGKYENVSGAVEALLIFAAAVWIVLEALRKLADPTPVHDLGLGMIVMGISALVNIGVSAHLFRVGRETESPALIADGWHLRTDVWTSGGVLVGLVIAQVGGPSFYWVDPVTAIAVAALITKAAWNLTAESVRDLLDVRLHPEEEQAIRDAVEPLAPSVCGVHNLRTRKSGNMRFIEMHITVDERMTVGEAHRLHDALVGEIKKQFPISRVMIHIEPCPPS
ncbi:MAG: cation diffusion facilitator family transporter [Armatimonadota bacterium]